MSNIDLTTLQLQSAITKETSAIVNCQELAGLTGNSAVGMALDIKRHAAKLISLADALITVNKL